MSDKPLEKATVTVDMTVADVLKLDEAGTELYFADAIDQFKQLTEEERKLLSQANRERWRASYALYRLNCEERDNPSPTKGLSATGRNFAPRSRFYIFPDTKNPAYEYIWPSPDRVTANMMLGAEVVTRQTDPNLRFTGGFVSEDGTPKIGIPGHVQHVCMRVPKEIYKEKYLDEPANQSRRLNMSFEESSKNQMNAEGGHAFTSKDKDLMNRRGYHELKG